MIIIMRHDATDEQIKAVVNNVEDRGYETKSISGEERTVIGVKTGRHDLTPEMFEGLEGVSEVQRINKPYKLASREWHREDSIVRVGDISIGDGKLCIIAGPCAVESEEQVMKTAASIKKSGANMLRGGAFKPRSSPYTFQGMGEEGLRILSIAGKKFGLQVVTEVMEISQIDMVCAYADILQIGARNMQNFNLLREVGKSKKPVLLKRGMSATLTELLQSAEYLLAGGCQDVILCLRGIRTFDADKEMRNTPDHGSIPALLELTHLPIIFDPSHACGHSRFVPSLTKSAIAIGAHSIIVEVHPDPDKASSDGAQSLTPVQFDKMMQEIRPIATASGRELQ